MLAESRRFLGSAFLVCVLILFGVTAFDLYPIWVLNVMICLVSLSLVSLLFKDAIRSDGSFVAFKTNNPVGAILMLLPFLAKGYPRAMESRIVLGRRRSAAGITTLYGAGMMSLALVCVLLIVTDKDGLGYFAAFSAVAVILAVSTIYSVTMAVLFSLSLAVSSVLFSHASPALDSLRLSIPFELASYWVAALACGMFAHLLQLEHGSKGPAVKRWSVLIVATAVSMILQIVLLRSYLWYAVGFPKDMPLFEWLRTFATSGVTFAFLALWTFAPLLTLALARWVDRNESTRTFPTTTATKGPVPETLARPIMGAMIGIIALAAVIWFIILLAHGDSSGEQVQAGNEGAEPALAFEMPESSYPQATPATTPESAPARPSLRPYERPVLGLSEPAVDDLNIAQQVEAAKWRARSNSTSAAWSPDHYQTQLETDPWYWQGRKLESKYGSIWGRDTAVEQYNAVMSARSQARTEALRRGSSPASPGLN